MVIIVRIWNSIGLQEGMSGKPKKLGLLHKIWSKPIGTLADLDVIV